MIVNAVSQYLKWVPPYFSTTSEHTSLYTRSPYQTLIVTTPLLSQSQDTLFQQYLHIAHIAPDGYCMNAFQQ